MKKAKITLKNINSNESSNLYIGPYLKCITFKDEDADYHITILNDGISIQRVSNAYMSNLLLKQDRAYCLVKTEDGEFNIDIKIQEYIKTDHLLKVVYDTGELLEIKIEIDGSME